MFCHTGVLVLRTGVKENDGNWMQFRDFSGCWGGKVVVRADCFGNLQKLFLPQRTQGMHKEH